MALVRAAQTANLAELQGANAEQTAGVKLLAAAVEAPLRQIAENAGWEGSVVANKVREGEGNFGFNARKEIFEDLTAAGVIDPTKVTRTALRNAASVSGLLLTTEAMIAEKPEEQSSNAAGAEMDY